MRVSAILEVVALVAVAVLEIAVAHEVVQVVVALLLEVAIVLVMATRIWGIL